MCKSQRKMSEIKRTKKTNERTDGRTLKISPEGITMPRHLYFVAGIQTALLHDDLRQA